MRRVLCLSILLAATVWAADEATDRAAITTVIATLSSAPGGPALFTEDFSDNAVLQSLGVFRDGARLTIHVGLMGCVSHEPWGELGPCVSAKTTRFATQSVRLITPDVALADATSDREEAGSSIHSQVLFVLRKEGDLWKIASLRVIAPSGAQ